MIIIKNNVIPKLIFFFEIFTSLYFNNAAILTGIIKINPSYLTNAANPTNTNDK